MEPEEKQDTQDQNTTVGDNNAGNQSADDPVATKPDDKDRGDKLLDHKDINASDEGGAENLSGDEFDDDDLSGDELDDDDLTGVEFDDDDLSGDELDDNDLSDDELGDDDLSGSELNKNDDTGNTNSVDAPTTRHSDDQSAGESGQDKVSLETASTEDELKASRGKPLKKIILATGVVIFMGVVAVIAYVLWPTSPEIETQTAAVQAPQMDEIVPVSMDAFLIPFSQGKFSYISLNVSIDVPTGRLRNEIIAKKELIRGQIYELLLMYVRELENTPIPNDIKAIISKSVNRSLSNGSVRELYLTQFIVI